MTLNVLLGASTMYFRSIFYKESQVLPSKEYISEERHRSSKHGTVSDWGDEICNERLDKSLGSPS